MPPLEQVSAMAPCSHSLGLLSSGILWIVGFMAYCAFVRKDWATASGEGLVPAAQPVPGPRTRAPAPPMSSSVAQNDAIRAIRASPIPSLLIEQRQLNQRGPE